MMVSRRRLLLAGAAAVLGGGAYAAGRYTMRGTPAVYRGPIVVATGATKGVYYQYGVEFAAAAGPALGTVTLRTTTGSVDNLDLLARGEVTFAFTAADAALDAFTAHVPVSALARLYDDYIHLVVRAESPVRALPDLRGLRVSVGPAGSGTALIADRILTDGGLDPRRDIAPATLGINESVTALAQRAVDAFFWSGGLPTSGVRELAAGTAVRLVELGAAAPRLRRTWGPSYRTGTIPAGTYPGMADAVDTVAVPNLLVTVAATPPTLVNRLTAALFASAARIGRTLPAAGQLDPRTSIFTEPIPLHPGARAYVRSVKSQV